MCAFAVAQLKAAGLSAWHKFDSRRNKTTGTYDHVIVTDTFAYVPILETLETIFQKTESTDMFKPRHMPKEEKDALQIQMFYDDFEAANPLGSKTDIMHDILEGVAQFEDKLALQYIQNNFLNAEQLAGRIHDFDYGYNQQRNHPPRVKLFDGSNDLGQMTSTGIFYFYYIVNIVFSPVLSEVMTIYLKHLIIDYHQLFKQLFPAINLLPKHHFMIHYPRNIRNIGPVLQMWCMCYEAKHNFFKKQLKSFKNITNTLAKKHQSCMAMYRESFSKERLTLGPGKMVTLSELKEGPEIASKCGAVLPTSVFSVKWMKHHGTEQCRDFIICTEVAFEMPVFCKIKTIAVKDDSVLFCGKLMETMCFDYHYHAFRVRLHPDRVLKVLHINELCYFKPFDVQMKYRATDSSFKPTLLSKLCQTDKSERAMDVFCDIRAKKSDIIEAGCELFKNIFRGNPSGDLEDLRFDIFSKRAAAGSIKPEKLPPTTGAAAQHSLRAYLQTRDWLMLQSPSLDVLEYGWKQGKHGYEPVPTTDPMAPDYLLKLVSCNCAGDCGTLRCCCKKQGVKCISACGNCHGNSCQNINQPDDNSSEGDAGEFDELC
ncbi:hypothetical protein N1851_002375 [Merluccius polli]|uniref:Tesmin/TSO1-like CXC domain-containing protein n=1 Tax=Merluccius polli TaxID=89951 RepID=A0AA47NA52_MERPO|nr:hypothetical protein N1851_002375 [Merluccius polli]